MQRLTITQRRKSCEGVRPATDDHDGRWLVVA